MGSRRYYLGPCMVRDEECKVTSLDTLPLAPYASSIPPLSHLSWRPAQLDRIRRELTACQVALAAAQPELAAARAEVERLAGERVQQADAIAIAEVRAIVWGVLPGRA